MSLRRSILLIALLWFTAAGAVCATFATPRLQRMASALGMDCTGLSQGVHHNRQHMAHPLTVRVNGYDEVEHIGFQIFPDDVAQLSSLPIYDFLERHLLERLLFRPGTEDDFRLTHEHVTCVAGNWDTVLRLDGSEVFTEDHSDFRRYMATWSDEGGNALLSIQFDMDCQLILGCNAIELEQRFAQRLQRQNVRTGDAPQPHGFDDRLVCAAPMDTFLIAEISNSLHYSRAAVSEAWSLTDNADATRATLANLLMATSGMRDVPLHLTLDCYGYRKMNVETTLLALKQMCTADGCQFYFGIKDKRGNAEAYDALVVMVNRTAGYLHSFNASVPQGTLRGDDCAVTGRLTPYIPLHNVSGRFLKLQ